MSNRTVSLELDTASWLFDGELTRWISLYSFAPEHRRAITEGHATHIVIEVESDNPDHDGVYIATIEDYDPDDSTITFELT